MTAPYTGRCACGRITVTIDAEPVTTRQCWCRECQRLAGGGATHNAMFPAAAVAVTGTTGMHSYVADSGNTLTQEFCENCGTPVLGRSSGRPGFRTIRFGLLDEGHGLRPAVAIWTERAPEWALIDAAMERHERQPPPPPPPN